SLYDLVADEEGRLLPVLEHLRRRAREEHGMVVVTYSLAAGLDWDEPRVDDARDRDAISRLLRTHGLLDVEPDENEVVRVVRGIAGLAQFPAGAATWADGRPMRFVFVLEFAEHLTPSGEGGGRTDQEIRAVELAHVLGQRHALRASGNLIVFHGREGLVDDLVTGVLHPVRLELPAEDETRHFVRSALRLYDGARLADGVAEGDVARLAANMPNRSVEGVIRTAHYAGAAVSVEVLLAQKGRDVVELSEGTLSPLDTRRVADLKLVGRNVEVPYRLLLSFGEALLRGDAHMPANVVLVGPPGTGKTDLCLVAALEARASAYQVHSPKGQYVGQTERRVRALFQALREWTPNVAFIDEITEAFPLERSDVDGDSGASRAITAEFLTALSDEGRRGRSLLVATTNCPWRMGEAMRSRFTMVPVLAPLREDYPTIVAAVVRRIAGVELDPRALVEASDLFYRKGASAREVRAELDTALFLQGRLDADAVLGAARDLCQTAGRASVEYADLWAVAACRSKRFLPWYGDVAGYPFPPHLDGLVDEDGEVRRDVLAERLEVLRPQANL
ncbi:MAG: AAA family ATPase, partial [Bacteroidota bacterium]